MEVGAVKKILQSLNLNENENKINKSFTNSLFTNRFVIGSAVIAGGTMLVNAIKKISIEGAVSSLFPSQLTNVSFVGIPVGNFAFKLLGYSVIGTVAVQFVKLAVAIKSCKSKSEMMDVILKECISFTVLVFTLFILGRLGVDLLNTANLVINL